MSDIIDNMKSYDYSQPIVLGYSQPIILGLAGKAATGKTSVAEAIVPKAQINAVSSDIVWEHIFFALPLYEMASIKKTIQGIRERDRRLYSLHSVIYELFGGSPIGAIPDYNVLIDLVKEIYAMPIEHEGTKPRSFLQKAGDSCRAIDKDCFAKWAISKSKTMFNNYIKSLFEDEEQLPFTVVISDVRFANEAEHILAQPNGIVVCYDASDEVRNQRLLNRDGSYMTDEQKNHISEQQIDIVKEMASVVINTDGMSVADQTAHTIDFVNGMLGINA